jgi:hypothetical protein
MDRIADMSSWQDLRMRLVDRIAILVAVVSGTGAWLLLPQDPFPAALFWLLLLLSGFGLGLRTLLNRHPRLAQTVLVWAPTLLLLTTMWLDGTAWLGSPCAPCTQR